MRSYLSSFLAIAATVPVGVLGHYNFEALIVNGNITEPYEYVRQTTNSNSPITDITSDDMICNQGGLDADIRAKTNTYSVSPGDEVGFTIDVAIGHPGPLAVYMSKAPDGTATSDYLGGGDWFKIYELSTSSITDAGLQWATYIDNQGIQNFTFTLPENLPAGNYLMRAESIAIHGASTVGGAQFYIGCAQLAVGGSGSGTPSPTVKIPRLYTGTEPGILINIYWPIPTNYTVPGPVTWPNACIDHTANLDGQVSDGDCTPDANSTSGSASASVAIATSTFANSIPTSSVPSNSSVIFTTPAAVFTTSVTPVAVSTPAGDQITSASSAAVVEPTVVSTSVAVPATTTTVAPAATRTASCNSARQRKSRKVRREAKRLAENIRKGII